jgi:4-amino-4-deoxy-L-arabinose transferase-like glycosyltransferase
VRRSRAVLLLTLATALPRLIALLHERGAIIAAFQDKGDNFAQTYLASGTYGFIPGHPSADTQPLYGWFLIPIYWIFGRTWEAVGLMQILVAVGTTLVVWQIGHRWLSPAAGIIGGLLVSFHPYLIWHDIHMNREILDQFLAASMVYLTLHAAERFTWRRAIPLGAAIGLGVLGNVRLEALPLVLGAYLLWRSKVSKRTLLACGAIILASVVVISPWVVRNKVSVEHGGWIDHVPQPKSFPPTPQDVFEHWEKTGVIVPYNECAQMTEFEHKVVHFWIHHPGEKARLVVLDAQWLWQPSVVETRGRPGAGTWLDTIRRYGEPTFMIPLYILGLIGLFFVPRFYAALAVLLLAYQTAIAVAFVGETRYRAPWDFLTGLLAAAALVAITERVRERRRTAAGVQAPSAP